MIFNVKDENGQRTNAAPRCPFHQGERCLMSDCAAWEWYTNYETPPMEKGFCGLTRGASFRSGRARYMKKYDH